jgi:hypothetical protein
MQNAVTAQDKPVDASLAQMADVKGSQQAMPHEQSQGLINLGGKGNASPQRIQSGRIDQLALAQGVQKRSEIGRTRHNEPIQERPIRARQSPMTDISIVKEAPTGQKRGRKNLFLGMPFAVF